MKIDPKIRDNILENPKTNYRVLYRNVYRTAPATQVRFDVVNKLQLLTNTDKERYALKLMNNDTCLAFSDSIDDLVLLVMENEWWFDGPKEAIDLLAIIAD